MSLFPEFTADHEMPLGGKGDLDHVGGDVQAVEGVDLGGEGDVHGDILPSFMRERGRVGTSGRVKNKMIQSIMRMVVLSLRF